MEKEPLYRLQSRFLWSIAKMIVYANAVGYDVTLGRGFETPEANRANGGIGKSLHLVKLAQDLCLFKDGIYCRNTEDYKILGDWWKAQGLEYKWGGDFKKQDGNHFSLAYGGMQ
jgi:hypothetical protein